MVGRDRMARRDESELLANLAPVIFYQLLKRVKPSAGSLQGVRFTQSAEPTGRASYLDGKCRIAATLDINHRLRRCG